MGQDVKCPICKQMVWVEDNSPIVMCGEDTHITEKEFLKMLPSHVNNEEN